MHFSSLFSKVFYAILLSPSAPKHTLWALIRHATLEKYTVMDRVILVVNLVDRFIPGIARAISRRIYENNFFPWLPVPTDLIAYGTGAAVFKEKWKNGDKALRIYRLSIGRSIDGLLDLARYYKKKYETVVSWYGGPLNLVLPMEFLVAEGMPVIGPVVISLQPYIHGPKYDPFDDLSSEEFLRLLDEHDLLREQFIFFAERTICQWEEGKTCYDFLGRKNVILVKSGTEYRLRIVDVGCFRLDAPSTINIEKMMRIEQRMARLISLYQSARRLTGSSKGPLYTNKPYGQLI